MIPLHERIFEKLKTLKVIDNLRRFPITKKISGAIRTRYMNERRKLVSQNGYDVLSRIFSIFENNNVELWLDWGTLLGYYRDGCILPHDYDLDVSTWRLDNATHAKLVSDLEGNGFTLVREFRLHGDVVTETYECMHILIDIEYYYGDHAKCRTCSFDLSEKTKLTQENGRQVISGMDVYWFDTYDLNIVPGQFSNGVKCYVPQDTERRVEEMYGKDWKIPVVNFSWKALMNYTCDGFNPEMCGWRLK